MTIVGWTGYLASRRAFQSAVAKHRDGDLPGAEEDYRVCLGLGSPKLRSAAGVNLGRMRLAAGDLDEARVLFESVIRLSKDDNIRHKASYNLGLAFLQQDHLPAAEHAFRWAMRSYNKTIVLLNVIQLVLLLHRTGRQEEATQLLTTGADLEHAAQAPMSVIELARLAHELDRSELARTLLAEVLRHTAAEPAALAHLRLAQIARDEGNHATALSESRLVLETPTVALHARAYLVLAWALRQSGDVMAGMEAWYRAGESDELAIRHIAIANIAEELIRHHNDAAAARPLLDEVMDGITNPSTLLEWQAVAAANLGQVFAMEHDVVRSKELWEQAMQSDHPAGASVARVYLARQLIREGDLPAAQTLLQTAIDTGPPEVVADARLVLTELPPDGGHALPAP